MEGDYGHYSIVTRIDRRSGLITLRDPYRISGARIGSFGWNVFIKALVGRQRRART